MTNQERLTLADRVQRKVQKTLVQFWILRRKELIEKEFNRENEASRA